MQIKDAVQKGATVATGGKPIPGRGYYFEPTVLLNVDHTMSVMMEETFGPLIGILFALGSPLVFLLVIAVIVLRLLFGRHRRWGGWGGGGWGGGGGGWSGGGGGGWSGGGGGSGGGGASGSW